MYKILLKNGFVLQASSNSPQAATEGQLLEMIRNGSHALEAYGIPSEVTKVSVVLAKVLQQCQFHFGSYRTGNTNKYAASPVYYYQCFRSIGYCFLWPLQQLKIDLHFLIFQCNTSIRTP